MPSPLHLLRRYAASPLAASVAALAVANTASGQIDDVIFDHHIDHPRLVFTDADVYFVGSSAILCEGKTEISPDPRGRYALIASTNMDLPAFLNEPVFPPASRNTILERGVGTSLLLYDSRTNRTKLIWQHRAHPGEVGIASVNWLNGKDVAWVTVGVDRSEAAGGTAASTPPAPGSDFTVIEVHPEAASGTAPRVLAHSDNFLEVEPSPHLPVALVHQYLEEKDADGKGFHASRYRFLNASGVMGPILAVGPHANGGYNWNDTGDTAYLSEFVHVPKVAAPAASEAGTPVTPTAAGDGTAPATELKRKWYAFDTKSGKLSPLDQSPKHGPLSPAAPLPVRLASAPIAATLTPPPPPPTVGGAPSTVPADRTAAQVWPLWLQRRTSAPPKEHRPYAALIAGDADSATLLPDASAVLYVADGALHAVPLTHQPRADVEGPYRKYLQQVTMSNAKQIGLATLMYSQDYDEMYPPAADFSKNVYPYLKNSDVFNNPETDQPAFQYLMDGNALAKIDSPATTVLGYLAGPDGRAALYADGHVKWESDPGTK